MKLGRPSCPAGFPGLSSPSPDGSGRCNPAASRPGMWQSCRGPCGLSAGVLGNLCDAYSGELIERTLHSDFPSGRPVRRRQAYSITPGAHSRPATCSTEIGDLSTGACHCLVGSRGGSDQRRTRSVPGKRPACQGPGARSEVPSARVAPWGSRLTPRGPLTRSNPRSRKLLSGQTRESLEH